MLNLQRKEKLSKSALETSKFKGHVLQSLNLFRSLIRSSPTPLNFDSRAQLISISYNYHIQTCSIFELRSRLQESVAPKSRPRRKKRVSHSATLFTIRTRLSFANPRQQPLTATWCTSVCFRSTGREGPLKSQLCLLPAGYHYHDKPINFRLVGFVDLRCSSFEILILKSQ